MSHLGRFPLPTVYMGSCDAARFDGPAWQAAIAECEAELALHILFGRIWLIPASHSVDSLGALVLAQGLNTEHAKKFRERHPYAFPLQVRPPGPRPVGRALPGYRDILIDFLSRPDWVSSALPEINSRTADGLIRDRVALRSSLVRLVDQGKWNEVSKTLRDMPNGEMVAHSWRTLDSLLSRSSGTGEDGLLVYGTSHVPPEQETFPALSRALLTDDAIAHDLADPHRLEMFRSAMKGCLTDGDRQGIPFSRSWVIAWAKDNLESPLREAFLALGAEFYHRELVARLDPACWSSILWSNDQPELVASGAGLGASMLTNATVPDPSHELELMASVQMRRLWLSAKWDELWRFLCDRYFDWAASLDNLANARRRGQPEFLEALKGHIDLLAQSRLGVFSIQKDGFITFTLQSLAFAAGIVSIGLATLIDSPPVSVALSGLGLAGFALPPLQLAVDAVARGRVRRAVVSSVRMGLSEG